MPTAHELQEVLPGVVTWQAFCFAAKVELTSHAISTADGVWLVDPIRLDKRALAQLDGPVAGVILTNGNHARDAPFYSQHFQVPIHASAEAAAEFDFATERFPQPLGSLKIVPLPGAGPGEIGIYDLDRKLLCLGDIIINLDSFAFAPLPAKYATDEKLMRQSVGLLATLDVDTICFAHGLPVTSHARQRLHSLLA